MFGWKTKTTGIHRRSIETSGAYDGGLSALTHGLMAGTHIASNLGWRVIEALTVGDMVLTFDHGMRAITEIRRSTVWLDAPDTDPAMWPLIIPKEALGNQSELTLLADQGVLVECDAAADMYDDPFAIVPALALEGVRGIYRAAPPHQIELIAVYFADEEVIYAEGGALIHCPTNTTTLDKFIDVQTSTYDVLNIRDAAFLAECLAIEDQILAKSDQLGNQMAAHC